MAEVAFQNVAKVYPDGTRAVDGLDLEIDDGEFMVLVGPSGCGKTTALRMVAGLEEISEGVVRIGERVVNHVPARDRDIAMVFQSYALYPHLTVYDNIAFGLRLRKAPKDEIDQRVRDAARILGLEEFLDRKPRALSGGQRQRVAMGRAIVREPAAYLMDEPLSNLDAKLRVHMRAEIASLQNELGVTTIYVTHDQVEAMTMGDRVAVMRKGELQQVAPPAGALRAAGQPLRRRLHRLAGDEHGRGDDRAAQRRARRATSAAQPLTLGDEVRHGARRRSSRTSASGSSSASARRASRTRRSSPTSRTTGTSRASSSSASRSARRSSRTSRSTRRPR